MGRCICMVVLYYFIFDPLVLEKMGIEKDIVYLAASLAAVLLKDRLGDGVGFLESMSLDESPPGILHGHLDVC